MIRDRDLDYELPPERIAQHPIRPRDAARLLVLDRADGGLRELRFADLAGEIAEPDLLVVNDTRVVPARLRGHKESGGRAEALLLGRRSGGGWHALLRCRGRLRTGLRLRFGELRAEVCGLLSDGSVELALESTSGTAPEVLLEKLGEAPLPPYIRRPEPRSEDLEDYQSIFAQVPGAVAAPTASLHFTPALARRLPIARVTLHVGPGTFRPLLGGVLEETELEAEPFCVPERTAQAIGRTKAAGGRLIAVGTTVARALETTGGAEGAGRTDLFIRPGYRFRAVDSLITNFHLPRSSLLALVMAFAGVERTRAAYAYAIERGFRFYSYGDAMWIR